MRKNYLSAFIMLLFLFVVIFTNGCKRDSVLENIVTPVPPPPTPTPTPTGTVVNDLPQVTASVSGSVSDENNVPVAGAVVTSGSATTATNSNGIFIFQNISLSKENGSVTVVKAGYFKGVRSFKSTAGKDHTVRLQLMQKLLSGTVNGGAGGIINSNGGATINFPADAFVTNTGVAYTSTVKVYSRWIDPTAANLPFIIPGDLRGISTNGVENILESYGMVGAELEDATGNTLQIATGKKATISFPVPASLQASASATIPLWHFDNATARWKENGIATKTGNIYSAQVDQFSFWNGDVPISKLVLLDYTLINATTNSPLVNTITRIKRASGGIEHIITNNAGFASLVVPKEEVLVLEVISGCNIVIYSQNIGPFASNTSLGNINITLPTSQYKNFTGRLINCAGVPVTNGYISFYANAASYANANTNASGNFSFSLLNCAAGNFTFNYVGVDNSTATGSILLTGTSTNGNVDINLGNITVCGTTSSADVYAVGSEEVSTNIYQAKLWKNGILTNLTDGTRQASATGMLLSGTDVYICGSERNAAGINTATVWKNGLLFPISNTSAYENSASSIYISGSDVYVAGKENNINSYKRAMLWKNGIVQSLTNGNYDSEATAVFVSGTDIYVSGREAITIPTNGLFPKLWTTNPAAGPLQINGSGYGNSIFVSGTDVYVGGYENNGTINWKAEIWKNGIPTSLTSGTYRAAVNAIVVVNSDVYAAGYELNAGGISIAKIWKNGIATSLTNGNFYADASSIFVLNGDVYVGGRERNAAGVFVAKIWKNGVSTSLTDGTKTAAAASIFVK